MEKGTITENIHFRKNIERVKEKGGKVAFKRISSLVLLVFVGMIILSSCKKEEKGKIIARVGKTTLTVEELLSQISPQVLINATPEVRMRLIDTWVSNEVIYQDALRNGLDKNPEVVKQIEYMNKQIITQAYIQDILASSRFISDVESRGYFKEHEEEYNTVIEVSHISVSSIEGGKEILEKLKKGNNFASLARKYSTDSATASKGGNIGSFRRGDLIRLPIFEQYALSLKNPGEITDLVQTEFGYDIIKLLSRKKSTDKVEYEDVAESIIQIIRQEKFLQVSNALIDSLKREFDIDMHPDVLDKELGISSPILPSLPYETGQ